MWAELSMRMPKLMTHGAEADDEVDGGELDDAGAQALQLLPGKGQAAVGEQDDEDAGDAEDGSRGSRADLEEDAGVVVQHE